MPKSNKKNNMNTNTTTTPAQAIPAAIPAAPAPATPSTERILRLFVAGSFEYANARHVAEVLGKIKPTTIISGGNSGLDRLAEDWAMSNGCEVLVNQAIWKIEGKEGVQRRDAQNCDEADRVLIFGNSIRARSVRFAASMAHKPCQIVPELAS